MTYDQWKCTDPREYDPEPEECPCEDYDADILTGIATCVSCGQRWMQSAQEIAREHEAAKAHDAMIARFERRERWLGWWDRLRCRVADRFRQSSRTVSDDEIPF